MKKIKSVKLLKDLPGCNAGKVIKKVLNCYSFAGNKFLESEISDYPDFFDITYEEDFFEVEDEKTEFIILGDGTIYDFINNNTCHYIQGNAGTKSEMEYRKMHNETMHYFRKLAEELNGDWRYEVGKQYRILLYIDSEGLFLGGWQETTYPCIKFNYELTIEQITSRAKPEMLENYKRICQNPY